MPLAQKDCRGVPARHARPLAHAFHRNSLPDLEYKRVVSCKDSFQGTDVLAVSEHGAPGRRPNIHAQFVGRQTEDGLDTLPRLVPPRRKVRAFAAFKNSSKD